MQNYQEQPDGEMNRCEKIRNGNPTDTSINDKSPKFPCYKLLWLSKGNAKKEIITIKKNRSVPFHIDQF